MITLCSVFSGFCIYLQYRTCITRLIGVSNPKNTRNILPSICHLVTLLLPSEYFPQFETLVTSSHNPSSGSCSFVLSRERSQARWPDYRCCLFMSLPRHEMGSSSRLVNHILRCVTNSACPLYLMNQFYMRSRTRRNSAVHANSRLRLQAVVRAGGNQKKMSWNLEFSSYKITITFIELLYSHKIQICLVEVKSKKGRLNFLQMHRVRVQLFGIFKNA